MSLADKLIAKRSSKATREGAAVAVPAVAPTVVPAVVVPKDPIVDVPVAEPIALPKAAVPKRPVLLEGINMSALSVAYFCMEIGVDPKLPTYAGGLGILAGDMLRSAADLDIPMIGVSLLYRKGYFKQRLDPSGWQFEEPEAWNPYEKLVELSERVTLTIGGRAVSVRAWLLKLSSVRGNQNPVIFLDTDIPENDEEDRSITADLYGGDLRHRLLQEAVLGIGGMRMLAKLGAINLEKFHMNEGHAALLTLELRRMYAACEDPEGEVRRRAVFTTHTPIAAGHDQFSRALVEEVLGKDAVPEAIETLAWQGDTLNMTHLGLTFSGYLNGVAKKHGEVTRDLFPGYQIESITNGVHAATWVAEPFRRLYDKYLPGWEADPYYLRYALSIPQEEIWRTHEMAKRAFIEFVNEKYDAEFHDDAFTIGFARRAAAYKRGNMLFADIDRLMRIAERSKGLQIVYAGKAHPADNEGKLLIQRIIENMRRVAPKIKCVYLEDYDMDMARMLVAGVDLWLNTPTRPKEASGTSGMKAALNGVPHFSILDGWWLEGHIENVTGWSIGGHPEEGDSPGVEHEEINDMYTKLEYVILPRYEGERDQWVKMMRSAIAINGSFFNTHRMVEQYVLNAYFK